MTCKPQIPLTAFEKMTTEDRMVVLYTMQADTMECVDHIKKKIEGRKLFDRISIIGGSVVGGVLGALGISQVK